MRKTLLFALTACLLTACYYRTDTPRGSWAKGCDLSWLSEMEHDSVFAYDCMAALHERGMNAVRLRVWVNHATGWSNKDDMVALAKRAAQQGLRVMVDIHYSDFFADPSHQAIPAAWKDYDYPTMLEAVCCGPWVELTKRQAIGQNTPVSPPWDTKPPKRLSPT